MPILSTSAAQVGAHRAHRLPSFEQVRPNVFALAFEMPASWLGHSYGYLIRDGSDLHLVDVGPDSESNWDRLRQAVGAIGLRVTNITTLTATHLHGDHIGLARRLQATSGTTVALHIADAEALHRGDTYVEQKMFEAWLEDWRVPLAERATLRAAAARRATSAPPFSVDATLADGDVLDLGTHALRVIHTPGHTRGHIVLVDDAAGLVFTGDHVLPEINTGVGLGGRTNGDDPIGDYLCGIDRLRGIGSFEALPGHGYRFSSVGARAARLREHYLRRAREVAAVRAALPDASLWDVASRLRWTRGWENLSSTIRFSALCQTAMHVARATRPLPPHSD